MCIDRTEVDRVKIGSLLSRVHEGRARLVREARNAGLRFEAVLEEDKDLRAQLNEIRARSLTQVSVEREAQTDLMPSEEEVELRCCLEVKEREAEALHSKLRAYQSMLEEAQGEMEEMQVNVRGLKQALEEAETKAQDQPAGGDVQP